jgi:signal transduction histidine kinase
MPQLRVLLLEDSPADAELALAALEAAGLACAAQLAAGRADFERLLARGGHDIVLADYSLPGYTGLEALAHVRAADALLPVILVSGALGEERAVEALRAGATDFVLKDNLGRLAPAVLRALEEARERRAHQATQAALELSERRLQRLSRRLLEVQEAERRHLARELHDDIGQGLTALKLNLESLARARDPAALPARVAESLETVRHTIERVRQLSLNLRPLQLDDLGLAAALRSHLDQQAKLGQLVPHFEIQEVPARLPAEVATACFRVAQEAINNIVRHARAGNVWLRLFVAGERLALSVRDDGSGFDVAVAQKRAAAGASLGVVSMEERVALAGGSFQIHSAPGQGTVVVASFPVGSP